MELVWLGRSKYFGVSLVPPSSGWYSQKVKYTRRKRSRCFSVRLMSHSDRIFALVLRVLCGEKPILVAVDGGREIGCRVGVQESKSVRAHPGERNDVPLKHPFVFKTAGGP